MKKLLLLLCLFSIIICQNIRAHAVQVAYCAGCSGLKVYVEHWHTTSSPATTTMTISVTVNGTTTNYTGSPIANIQNVPFAQLPGCTDTLKVLSACNGGGIYQANTHNDWVIFDFPGIQCGVPVSFTVVSGNNAFTSDACSMFPAVSSNFTIPCDSGTQAINIASQTVCSGDSITGYNFPPQSGVTYAWENSDTLIGIAASGYGNIPSFIAGNVTAVTTANLKVSYGCKDTTVTITVNPKPVANFSYADFCKGDTTYFSDSSQFYSSAKKWYWDYNLDNFPDDSITSPKHILSGLPPFNVNLAVIDSLGCKSDTTITVASASPSAAYTLPVVCKDASVQMTDASTISNPYTISAWQWDVDNNGSIEYILQNPIHTFNTAGFIPLKLVASSNTGCKDSIIQNVFVQICTSINNEGSEYNISLYPNPFSSTIILEANKAFSHGEIIVLNILGEEVKRINLVENTNFNNIDLSALKSGSYFVLVKSNNVEWRKQVFKR